MHTVICIQQPFLYISSSGMPAVGTKFTATYVGMVVAYHCVHGTSCLCILHAYLNNISDEYCTSCTALLVTNSLLKWPCDRFFSLQEVLKILKTVIALFYSLCNKFVIHTCICTMHLCITNLFLEELCINNMPMHLHAKNDNDTS